METWKNRLLALASSLEHKIDKGRLKAKIQLGLLDKLSIQLYRGYGNQEKFFLTGRVLEEEGLDMPLAEMGSWDNLRAMYHRYESDEIPEARLELAFYEQRFELLSNQEGYFHLQKPAPAQIDTRSCWQPVQAKLLPTDHIPEKYGNAKGESFIQFPCEKTKLIVVSDVDDTIVISKATRLLEKLRILMFSNAQSRKPFAGVAAFYRALKKGASGQEENMFFYLSSSSWNLYDLFDRFCEINKIPRGCFLLREIGLESDKFFRSSHGNHKLAYLRQLFALYPKLPFVLVGDSGQHDPEIYQQLASEHPEQIKAIYIRDVKPEISDEREQEVHRIAEEVCSAGVPMLLVADSLAAARDAAKRQLIDPASLGEIGEEKQEDEAEEDEKVNSFLGFKGKSK